MGAVVSKYYKTAFVERRRKDALCGWFGLYCLGYIEEMEKCTVTRYQGVTWASDYANLKRYRYIRNRIAHDNNVYEEDVCEASDERWLRAFHDRVLRCEDALAVYYRLSHPAPVVKKQPTVRTAAEPARKTEPTVYTPTTPLKKEQPKRPSLLKRIREAIARWFQ